MERNKAARPDGLPAKFFQDCWEIIKDDLLRLVFYLSMVTSLGIKRMHVL
jgi:hypothetical protein